VVAVARVVQHILDDRKFAPELVAHDLVVHVDRLLAEVAGWRADDCRCRNGDNLDELVRLFSVFPDRDLPAVVVGEPCTGADV